MHASPPRFRGLPALLPTRIRLSVSGAIAGLLAAATSAQAAIYTYDISSYPSIQSSATVSGNITINTAGGIEDPAGSGNFFVGNTALLVWNFTVTPTVGAPYTGSSTGTNPSVSGAGGSLALYATPTTLSVVGGASLFIQSEDVPGIAQQLQWSNNVGAGPINSLYSASNSGATWFETNGTTLNNTFPENTAAGVSNWVIATAIPEPGTTVLVGLGLVYFVTARSRRFRSR